MNEKLSFQNISDALVQQAGGSKKVADAFVKAFFDTIVEALCAGDETVKVKGFGAFKLGMVESRESVNVANGERIVIPGYKRVTFTPENSVVEFLNRESLSAVEVADAPAESAVQESPSAVVPDAKPVDESPDSVEALFQVEAPSKVEQPQDAFAGIDLLISTPESLEDIRQQYEAAKDRMDVAVAEARKANAEKLRLEKLLERMEANVQPENMMKGDAETQPEKEKSSVGENAQPQLSSVTEAKGGDALSADQKSPEERRQEAFKRVMSETPSTTENSSQEEAGERKKWPFVLAAVLALAIAFCLYLTFRNIEDVETVPSAVQANHPVAPTPKVAKPVKAKPKDSSSASSADKSADKAKQSIKSGQSTNAEQSANGGKSKTKEKSAKADSVAHKSGSATSVVAKQSPKDADTKKAASEQQQGTQKKTSASKPVRPATHVMQRGESLTRISQRYYGTKDSVRAIIRANTFKDPDNVPIGAVVKLP